MSEEKNKNKTRVIKKRKTNYQRCNKKSIDLVGKERLKRMIFFFIKERRKRRRNPSKVRKQNALKWKLRNLLLPRKDF